MKKSIITSLLMTAILISCQNEKKQSNLEKENTQENQVNTENQTNNEKQSVVKTGQVLVAKSTIEDPKFSKSIILVTLIKKGKIYGVMLNKTTDDKIENYVEDVKSKNIVVGFGGPVGEDLAFIQTYNSTYENPMKILDGLHFMGDVKSMKDKLQNNISINNEMRFFKGMVVWNIDQLDKELNEWQDWKVIDLSVNEIMSINQNSWDKYNK